MTGLESGCAHHLSLSRLWYTGSPMKGGTTYGQSTVHRCAGPPHRVPGFHESLLLDSGVLGSTVLQEGQYLFKVIEK
jgi:hypothetical protein